MAPERCNISTYGKYLHLRYVDDEMEQPRWVSVRFFTTKCRRPDTYGKEYAAGTMQGGRTRLPTRAASDIVVHAVVHLLEMPNEQCVLDANSREFRQLLPGRRGLNRRQPLQYTSLPEW